jgi:hypothetical protein
MSLKYTSTGSVNMLLSCPSLVNRGNVDLAQAVGEIVTSPPENRARALMERLRPRLPTLALFVSLTVVFVIRYVLVRQHLDMGPDIANYLTTMNTFFGHDVTGNGLLRPPLIALPLKAFTLVFGELNGAKLLGVFISVAIGLPFYLIARRVSHRWIAVAMTIVFVLTPAYANMLSWGYITMFGIFFTLLAVYFFLSILEVPTKRNVALAGLCTSLVFGFHQLTAAFFVPLFVVLFATLLLLNRDQLRKNLIPFTAGVAVAAILSLPYIPVYIHLLQMQSSEGGNTALSTTPFVQFASDIPWLWAIILLTILGLLILASLRHHDRSIAILLAVLLMLPLILMIFPLRPPFTEISRRAHFFLYAPIWAIAGFVLSRLASWRPLLSPRLPHNLPKLLTIGLVASLLIAGMIVSQRELHRGLAFYSYLDDTRWNAVQWTKLHTPEDAILAAYPENLGWWIEGAAPRTVFEVTDRNMEANSVERQRALIAEQLLSRNRGLDNGYIRLATCYPYTNAPGNPIIGVYVGGKYQDLLMFDDSQSGVQIEGSAFDMNSATSKEFSTDGDSASMQTMISYHFNDATITQILTLEERSQRAVVTYTIQSNGQAVTRLHIPSFFCYKPKSVSADSEDGHIEIVQELETPFHGIIPVTTRLSVDVTGATFETPKMQEDRVPLAFGIHSANASVTLAFDISTTQQPNGEQVVAYEVPQLIKDNAIGYLAIDLKPDSPLWSDLPLGLEQWLNTCPYYKLIYSEGDIRIYQVDTSALP